MNAAQLVDFPSLLRESIIDRRGAGIDLVDILLEQLQLRFHAVYIDFHFPDCVRSTDEFTVVFVDERLHVPVQLADIWANAVRFPVQFLRLFLRGDVPETRSLSLAIRACRGCSCRAFVKYFSESNDRPSMS